MRDETTPPLPPLTDRQTWQDAIDRLRAQEKAHTRVGDALAAQRRRLPAVEVDPGVHLLGADGPATLLEAFDRRSQLIAYFHMWHPGEVAANQCPGCTFFTTHVSELAYLHARDVTYATFCEGPYEESVRYRDFMGWPTPWYSVPADSADELIAGRHFGMLVVYRREGDRVFETYWTTDRGVEPMAPSYGLLDMTPFGRQEAWEDSPAGWPRRGSGPDGAFGLDGRPTAQWSRVRAGRDEDLSPS